MLITKFTKQKVSTLKIAQPDLLKSIELGVPNLSEEDMGKVAGLIIEYVIKSGGNTSIFYDTDTLYNTVEEIEEELY